MMGGKAEWAIQNQGCGGQCWETEDPRLTLRVLHRVASLPSLCSSLTGPWQC